MPRAAGCSQVALPGPLSGGHWSLLGCTAVVSLGTKKLLFSGEGCERRAAGISW